MAAHTYKQNKQNKQAFQKKSEGRKARIRDEKSAGFRAARVILNKRGNAESAADKSHIRFEGVPIQSGVRKAENSEKGVSTLWGIV